MKKLSVLLQFHTHTYTHTYFLFTSVLLIVHFFSHHWLTEPNLFSTNSYIWKKEEKERKGKKREAESVDRLLKLVLYYSLFVLQLGISQDWISINRSIVESTTIIINCYILIGHKSTVTPINKLNRQYNVIYKFYKFIWNV